jgi:gluconate:H+ symporter, GntP family
MRYAMAGLEKTLSAIVDGFRNIMAEVGLLIGFGVLIGSLLYAMGALQRLVCDGIGWCYAGFGVVSNSFAGVGSAGRAVRGAGLAAAAARRRSW